MGELETKGGVCRVGADAIRPFLDAKRRVAWRNLFLSSVEFLTTHRRYFANQSQIVDTSAHWCNRALKICDETAGPPLSVTAGNVKEAMGLRPMPNGYVALTAKGLSKEDGYVGSYGESTVWASADAYEATEDAELLAQLVKATRARLVMRYPGIRRDGRRTARLEAQVSWRNEHFPPPPTYLTNNGDIRNAALADDPAIYGAVRDMYEDGILADYVRDFKGNDLSALRFLAYWPKVKAAIDKRGDKLPHLPCFMTRDFAWCDSEDGIAVVKRGDEMLFVEAYWRARGGVNNLAKVHFVRPDVEISATVACDETFVRPDGREEKIGNWFQYGWMGKLYGGYRDDFGTGEKWPPENATAGAVRPVAENGGRAEFYVVRYGGYVVAINDSLHGKSYELEVPEGEWTLLPSGDHATNGKISVRPKSCAVVWNPNG